MEDFINNITSDAVKDLSKKAEKYYQDMIQKYCTPFQIELFTRCCKEIKPYPFDDIKILHKPTKEPFEYGTNAFVITLDLGIEINGVEHWNELN